MDTILIFERLDRLERLITANKEVLTFEETCYYTGYPGAIFINSLLKIKYHIPSLTANYYFLRKQNL